MSNKPVYQDGVLVPEEIVEARKRKMHFQTMTPIYGFLLASSCLLIFLLASIWPPQGKDWFYLLLFLGAYILIGGSGYAVRIRRYQRWEKDLLSGRTTMQSNEHLNFRR